VVDVADLINPGYDSIIIFQSNRATQITEWTTRAADRLRLQSVIASREGLDPDMQVTPKKKQKYSYRFSTPRGDF